MATIVTRASKGSALTWTEGDANITNLNTDKIENVVEDTTPQLGGDLDVNGNSIVSASNGNITITPNGTGSIVLDGQNWPQSPPTTEEEYLSANSSGVLTWTDRVKARAITEVVVNSSAVDTITKGTPVYQVGVIGNTISVAPADAGDPNKMPAVGVMDETILPEAEGIMLVLGEIKGVDTSQFASGDKVYVAAGGGYTNVKPTASNVEIQFLGVVNRVDSNNGSGYITGTLTEDQIRYRGTAFEGWTGSAWTAIYTETDPVVGAINGIVKADGAGNISRATAGLDYLQSETFTELVQDTSPQLGGNLDTGNFKITNSNGFLEIDTPPTGNIYINADSGELTLTTSGGGNGINIGPSSEPVTLNGQIWPASPGSNGYVLTADGLGGISWSAPSGISNVIEDTTPQLGGELDARGQVISNPVLKDYAETIHSLGTTDTPTITISNGNVQSVTITSGLALPAFADAAAGQSVTLLVTGSGTATGTANHKFAGGNTTLTTSSVVSIFYDGTTYWTSIATDFQ